LNCLHARLKPWISQLTMLKKNTKIEKIYYSIGEVAELFDVNASLIRFWEKEFDILKPMKNKKGNRLFTQKDLDNLRIIYHLVKERGFTLQGAKDKLKENKEDVVNKVEAIDSLNRIKGFLLEIKEHM
jgi:DNA-binding transcriptional MerR regulator